MKSYRIPLRFILMLAAALVSLPALADEAFDACLKSAGVSEGRCGEEWVGRAQARLDAAWLQLLDVAGGAGIVEGVDR